MQKKFLSNLSFLLILNLLVKPFYILGIDAEVQNQVGSNTYGIYFAILNFSFIFNILNDFGITNFNNRNIAQNADRFHNNFGKLMVSRIMLGLSYALVTMVGGYILLYDSDQLYLLSFIVINQIIVSYIIFMRSNLAGLHLFKKDSIISVLDRLLLIIFCGALLWGNFTDQTFQIEWFVYLQTLSYVITFIVALFFLNGRIKRFKFEFNWAFTIAIIKKSIPYALLILLMSVYYRVDGVMLERMLPDANEAGIYAQGFRFLEALYNFSFLFAVLLLPIFSRMIAQDLDVTKLTALSSKLLLSGVILVCIIAYFYAFDIINWRYDQNVIKASECFKIVILNGIALSSTYIFGTLLTAAGKLKALNITALVSMVLNVVLNFILIPQYLALGSAWASLITLFASALVQLAIIKHHFNFNMNYKLIGKLIVLSLGIIGLCLAFRKIELHWFSEMLIIGGIGLGISFFIKLFAIKEFVDIIKEDGP